MSIILNPIDDQFGRPDSRQAIFFDATRKSWPVKDKELISDWTLHY